MVYIPRYEPRVVYIPRYEPRVWYMHHESPGCGICTMRAQGGTYTPLWAQGGTYTPLWAQGGYVHHCWSLGWVCTPLLVPRVGVPLSVPRVGVPLSVPRVGILHCVQRWVSCTVYNGGYPVLSPWWISRTVTMVGIHSEQRVFSPLRNVCSPLCAMCYFSPFYARFCSFTWSL